MQIRTDVAVLFAAQFTESKVGKTGLTVTVNVYRVTTSGVSSTLVTGGSATELGKGLYFYLLSAGSNTTAGVLYAVFMTSSTAVDQQEVPAAWGVELPAPAAVLSISNGALTQAAIADGAITTVKAPSLAEIAAIKAKTDVLPAAFPNNFASLVISVGGSVVSTLAGNAIDETAVHASAVSKIQFGLASATALDAAAGNVSALVTRVPGIVQPQTGDSYAVVAHATHGNAQLMRAASYTAPPTAASIWAAETRALTDKAGFSLASSGLDAIAATEPNGNATTWPAKLMQLAAMLGLRRNVNDKTNGLIKTYRADGATVNVQRAYTSNANEESVGSPQAP